MLPRKPLTNIDIEKYVKDLDILNFRGVFMRNKLPKIIRENESGIINLDDNLGQDTYWTGYFKKKSV